MIQHHVHNGSTDQFKQVGVREKNDGNEINSVDDHNIWLCIRVTFSPLIGKFLDCLLTDLWPLNLSFVSSFLLVVGCVFTFAKALSNMPQSSLMATGQLLHVFVCKGLTALLTTEVKSRRCLLVAVILLLMCCHTGMSSHLHRAWHPTPSQYTDTGHGTPPRHSIQTQARPVVVLSIDVCIVITNFLL